MYLQLMKPVADVKMFTFRLNAYQFIKYLLIFSVSSEVIVGQAPKKCAEFNEYCLNHWDCCSNSCMSYLYRCTRGHGVYPYPFLGVSYKPTVTLDDILEQNFGSPNAIPMYQPKQSLDDVETKVAQQEKPQKPNSDAVTLKAADVLEENNLDVTTLRNAVDLEKISAATKHQLGEEITETYKNSGTETSQAEVKRSTERIFCSEIGDKCFNNDECCTKRCHGYLHQCVT